MINENDLKILAMFSYEEKDDLGRITVKTDASNKSYEDFAESCSESTDLTRAEIDESAMRLHKNRQIDLGYRKNGETIELISIKIRKEGWNTYCDYRDHLTSD